ncbi:MAG: prepilin peptidase, partial [Oscillospiraceae bacterium]|nr:prepilin peptidase [Oscillospiraceae bacterium]
RMILTVLIGSVSGVIIHSVRMKRGAGRKLAFGPYLAAGLWISALFGNQILTAYLSLFGL